MTPTTTELVYVAELPQGALFVGVEGPRSLAVQQQLISLAILPSTAADSKYGPGTAAGVRRFQESQGLIVDGVAGPITLAALASAVTAGSSTTPQPPATSDEHVGALAMSSGRTVTARD
jgi:peptidoglycan hydrolase-like protein with peptidoglycan-binding domain